MVLACGTETEQTYRNADILDESVKEVAVENFLFYPKETHNSHSLYELRRHILISRETHSNASLAK